MTSNDFWLALSLIGAAGLIGYWLFQRVRRRRARTWPTETGRVNSTAIRLETRGDNQSVHVAEVSYSYAVGGQSYSGQLRRTFLLIGRAEKWISRYPQGAPVRIRYNPQNAGDSLLFEDEQVEAGTSRA
jgi:hypothetical protein